MQDKHYARLLKAGIGSIAACEGKTAPIIEDELGLIIGVSAASIQRYKAGHLPPEIRTVEILAEAIVKRGYLNREWLQKFLQASRYPAPERLLDRLCPSSTSRVLPDHVRQNLPAPTYNQFVMRTEAYTNVLEGLSQRSAVVLIVSLAGMGKTSLACEVAHRCLQVSDGMPRFDSVVWISDKDRPGTTTLGTVLDEIARTLDYPGLTQFGHDEKRREVEYLLRGHRTLLVIDNFETVVDGTLVDWVRQLPEPSKVLLTSREFRHALRDSWPVELHGMNKEEAQELIKQRLRRLGIDKLVSDPSQLMPLVSATGGNPKAIEMTLGQIKYERRPLQQLLNDLETARGVLFDDLFARSWGLLDTTARQLLLTLTLFSAGASAAALTTIADVYGFAFEVAVERLIDLALVDVQQADVTSPPRYALHPLVRAFVGAKLAEYVEFERQSRRRWLNWYVQLATQVGYCWEDLRKLELLDPEQDTIHSMLQWALKHRCYAEVLQLVQDISFYYFVRGIRRTPPIWLIAAEAASHLTDAVEEIKALAYHVQWVSRQGDIVDAEPYLPRLSQLVEQASPPREIVFEYQHAVALYHWASGDLDTAQAMWENNLAFVPTPYRYATTRTLIAACLYAKGKLSEARELFSASLNEALRFNAQRAIIHNLIKLAAIDLDLGQHTSAAKALEESYRIAQQYQDREQLAQIQVVYAQLQTLQGDIAAACITLNEAIDLFKRMGMRLEIEKASAQLALLKDHVASEHSIGF